MKNGLRRLSFVLLLLFVPVLMGVHRPPGLGDVPDGRTWS